MGGGFYELKDYHNISLLQHGWKGNIDITIKKIVKNYDSVKLMASREKLFKNFNQENIYNQWLTFRRLTNYILLLPVFINSFLLSRRILVYHLTFIGFIQLCFYL